MLLRIVAVALLLLHYSEANLGDGNSVQTPPKCAQCAGANMIQCGHNIDGLGNNCVCGPIGGPPAPCDDACCESTPRQCCQDPSSTSFACAGSVCQCVGGVDGDPFCKPSPVTCCPAFIRDSGRKLKEQSDLRFAGTEREYKDFVDACGEEDYKISLYVGDTHFSGIAVPATDDIDAACPSFVVAHVVFDEEGPATKELLGWHNNAEGMSHFPKESAPIGTFKAKDIALAFETAEPSGAGAYDYLTNNCANFMINMANVLGVRVDSTITAYVTRRLLEDSGSALVDKIKESTHFRSYFDGRHLRGDMRDEELLQFVVDARATDIMA